MMTWMGRRRVLFLLLAAGWLSWGGSLSDAQRRQVAALESKLLAPCCYREPVGRHQSEDATRMRLEIARLVEAGRTETEIVGMYVARYGEKVVSDYAPAPGWAGYFPWLLTAAAGLLLSLWIWGAVKKKPAAAG